MSGNSFQNPGANDGNSPAISDAEFQSLVEMVGADMPEVLVDLLDTYIEESTGLVQSVSNGVATGDLESVLRPAHSLKSSSASIGAMQLSKLCADLEAHLRGSLLDLDVPRQAGKIVSEFERVHSALIVEKAKLSE